MKTAETPDPNDLALATARTLVTAMVGDKWDMVRARLSSIMGLGARMSDDQRRLVAMDPPDRPEQADDLVVRWRTRVHDALTDDPQRADPLQRAIDSIGASAGATSTGHQTLTATTGGQAVAYGGSHYANSGDVYVGSTVDKRKTFRLSIAPLVHLGFSHPVIAAITAVVVIGGGGTAIIIANGNNRVPTARPAAVATGTIGAAFAYAPAAVRDVDYTNWQALGRPRGIPTTGVRTAGPWINFSAFTEGELGVQLSEATWELNYIGAQDGTCDIFQWPNSSGPNKITAGLESAGWQKTTTGHTIFLTRTAPPTGNRWGWTSLKTDFGVDTTSHRVAQCQQKSALAGALDGLGPQSLASASDTTKLVAALGDATAVALRSGVDTCIPPPGGGIHFLSKATFTTATAAIHDGGKSATIVLAYPSVDAATAALASRKAEFAAAQAQATGDQPTGITEITVDGPLIVAQVDSASSASRTLTDFALGRLGINNCDH